MVSLSLAFKFPVYVSQLGKAALKQLCDDSEDKLQRESWVKAKRGSAFYIRLRPALAFNGGLCCTTFVPPEIT